MFQYAFGRTVAQRLGSVLLLDTTSGFTRDPFGRAWKLHRFPLCDDSEMRTCPSNFVVGQQHVRFLRIVAFLQRLVRIKFRAGIYYEQSLFGFDPGVYSCKYPTYFVGYWQNLHYFEENADAIRCELKLPEPERPDILAIADEMRAGNSVAIHCRQYNYADLKHLGSLRSDHLTLDDSYYERVIADIERSERDAVFYYFSDISERDPVWLKGKNCRRIAKCQIQDDVLEQWLMSRCRHQVIANSTYSWWAAWLNNDPRKRVFAPRKWFKGELSVDGILPKQWEVIG